MLLTEITDSSTYGFFDTVFVKELRVQSSKTEMRVEFVDVAIKKVDHLREEVEREEIL